MALRTRLSTVIPALACVAGWLAHARPAAATPVWTPLGTGCASSIAVGPNNVPWVVGCAAAPYSSSIVSPQEIYYLNGGPNAPPSMPSNCTSQDGYPVLECPAQWKSDGFKGVTIAVQRQGIPFVTDANGNVYTDMPCNVTLSNGGSGCGAPGKPNGSWVEVTAPAVSSIAIGATTGITSAFEMWETNAYSAQGFPVNDVAQIWGVGCGSSCSQPMTANGGLYTGTITSGDSSSKPGGTWSGWSNMGYGGAATTFALFTDPNGSQTPWVLNSQGTAFVWSGEGWVPQPVPNQAGATSDSWAVTSLTDHFAMQRYRGEVYEWTGTSSGLNAGWAPYVNDFATNPPGGFVDIVQIAWSQSDTINGVTYGPSMLWGIDYQGNVYYVTDYTPPLPPH